MTQSLQVLIIEDSEYDMHLLLRELRKGHFEPTWKCIQTEEEFIACLADEVWQIVICDYSLPNFGAPAALEILNRHTIDLPFIVVSGAIGECRAVEMMRAGAHDYVMKRDLTRLPEAVRRELKDANVRAERQHSEQVLAQQMAAIEAAIDGIAILKDDVYLYSNQSHYELFGYQSSEELLGKTWQELYTNLEVSSSRQREDIGGSQAWQGEALATRKDGSSFYLGVSHTLTNQGVVISVCRDISDLKQAREQIIHNALHDPLTNLPNRKLLFESIERSIQRSKRTDSYHYAILFLDLDRFKVVNDSLGHVIGDQLLKAVAERLMTHIRTLDLVARLGGDEFVILLDDISDSKSVINFVERILADFQAPIDVDSHRIFVNFSIGIVLGAPAYHQASDLIRDADTAMYRAKLQEHSSFRFFDVTMHAQALDRLVIENDLRNALRNQELAVYYQPIYRMGTSQLYGFEALVRWHHPVRGLILPDIFIPVAEETGMIMELDKWVFRQACEQMVIWKHKFPHLSPLKISINLSAQDLRNPNLLLDIDTILAETALDNQSITLEITESMVIENIDQTLDVLAQINHRNIEMSIDDFGTGYSSLQYLHRLPVDYLKIDRSFVSQMQQQERNRQVINTILALSHQIGLKTVAEGIENVEQAQMLQSMGCRLGQGYYYSQPQTSAEIENKMGAS